MFFGSPLYFEGFNGLKKPLYAMNLFINKKELSKRDAMAIIKLSNSINSFKRNLGGVANRLVNDVVSGIENRLENAVENTLAKGLNKIGLSGAVSSQIVSRFTDSVSVGRADNFFRSSTAEQNRVSPQEIENRLLGGLSETTFDAVQKINTADITSAEVMRFPDETGEYYMSLDFQNYSRPSPQTKAEFKRFKKIVLPIPRDLKESFDLNVDGKASEIGGLVDIGTDIFRGAGAKAGGEFAFLYSKLIQFTEGVQAGAGDALAQAIGAVPNPHLQAIFSGVDLRNHTFQWTFAPRNPQESKNLKAIIHEIKKNSLPSYSTMGTAALQYPPMVEIKLMPWGDNLIRFKKCLVKSVSINYSPSGLPSFFQGEREPTMIQLEIQLLETEIQTANDYSLAPGQRDDGIEQFKDLIVKTAEKAGFKDELDKAKNKYDQLKNSISSGAQTASTRRGQ